MEDRGYSIPELSELFGYSEDVLNEVYERGLRGGGIPEQYLANLTKEQRARQTALINKSKMDYKEGKVEDRPKVSKKPTKRSSHVVKFEAKYGFPITNKTRLRATFPDTDIEKILSKGAGAYGSSGSRPNVSIAQWSYARLASVLTGGPSLRIDKDLVGPASMRKIKGLKGGGHQTAKCRIWSFLAGHEDDDLR
jgi:hypothetical protein